MKQETYRHGDVLLKPIKTIPKDAKPNGQVIAEGEVTGHRHFLKGNAQVLVNPTGKFVEVMEDTELVHEEHKTLLIGKGKYQVIIEKEYNPFAEAIRQVAD